MMLIVAVGLKQPSWVAEAFADYLGRFPPDIRPLLREIKAEPRTSGKTVAAMKQAEAERIEAAIPKGAVRIALDERGRALTTSELSTLVDKIRMETSEIAFVIGGPDGLDDDFKSRCQHQLRLSSMTLPHGMVRALLAEQLYRAWSISTGHPYHRE